MKKISFTLLIAVMSLAVGGCSVDAGSVSVNSTNVIPEHGPVDQVSGVVRQAMRGKRIGWVPVGLGIPLTENWTSELKRGFEQLGAQLLVRDAGWDAGRMPDIVDGLINARVDALVLHNPDVGVLTSQIQRAKQEGIYVITLNMMPSQQSDAFVGGDFQSMGSALAQRVVRDCKASGRSKVAAIDGYGTDGASVAARSGWERVLKDAGVELVSEQSANYLPDNANKIARTVLQQQPDLCAFLGNFDTMMQGASAAVAQTGKTGQIGVYTIDASAPSCANIKAGTLTAAVSYGVPAMGDTVVAMVQSMIQSGVAPGSTRSAIFMPYQIVDRSNVDDVSLACYSKQ